jgi:cystathionine beta-lyase
MGHPYDTLLLADLRRRRSDKWQRFPQDVLPLWIAEMDYPIAEPIRQVVTEMMARGDTGYPNAAGLPQAYAAFAARRYELHVDPTRVWPVLDVMRGVHLALELFTAPGDAIAVNPPVYPPFFRTIVNAGRRVVEAPLWLDPETRAWQLDLESLEKAFTRGARAYLLCSPHNPVGRVWAREDLLRVAGLADRYGVRVIVDEVHAPLVYQGARHVPFAALPSPAARGAIVLASASKAWNLPGLKCAMAVAGSAPVAAAFRTLPDEVRIEPSILGIAANEAAFRDGAPWLDDTLAYLDANRRFLEETLATRLPGIRWSPPQATYLGWLDFRELGFGADPAGELLARGRVALTSGSDFGSGGAGFARINFATSRAILEDGLERVVGASHPERSSSRSLGSKSERG